MCSELQTRPSQPLIRCIDALYHISQDLLSVVLAQSVWRSTLNGRIGSSNALSEESVLPTRYGSTPRNRLSVEHSPTSFAMLAADFGQHGKQLTCIRAASLPRSGTAMLENQTL